MPLCPANMANVPEKHLTKETRHMGLPKEYYLSEDHVVNKSAWESLFLRLRHLSRLKNLGVYLEYDVYSNKIDESLVLSRLWGWTPGVVVTVSLPTLPQNVCRHQIQHNKNAYEKLKENAKGVSVVRRKEPEYYPVSIFHGVAWRIHKLHYYSRT